MKTGISEDTIPALTSAICKALQEQHGLTETQATSLLAHNGIGIDKARLQNKFQDDFHGMRVMRAASDLSGHIFSVKAIDACLDYFNAPAEKLTLKNAKEAAAMIYAMSTVGEQGEGNNSLAKFAEHVAEKDGMTEERCRQLIMKRAATEDLNIIPVLGEKLETMMALGKESSLLPLVPFLPEELQHIVTERPQLPATDKLNPPGRCPYSGALIEKKTPLEFAAQKNQSWGKEF